MGTLYSEEHGHCIVTESLDGGSLQNFIKSNPALPFQVCLALFPKIYKN